MPWVRIDENAMDHPKFLALSDGAWRLWCEGQAYCQKHLTDGLILASALRGFRHYSRPRLKLLTAVLVPEKGPCWHQETDGNYRVHDFFDWNESRADVLKERAQAKERRERWREHRRNATQDASLDAEKTASVVRGVVGSSSRSSKDAEGGSGETAISARAGAFCDWYSDTHERLFGVGYMGTNLDYTKALELCKKFRDEQLRDGALVWFGMEDDFATSGTRTIPKFASRITGCLQAIKAKGIA